MAPRHTVLLLTVMVCLLMLTSFAQGQENQEKQNEGGILSNIPGILKDVFGSFLSSNVLSSFSISQVLGLFNAPLANINNCGEQVGELHEQSLNIMKKIEEIFNWASAASLTASEKTDTLTKQIQELNENVQKGSKEVKKIEGRKKIIATSKTEAEDAIKDFKAKETSFIQMIANLVAKGKIPAASTLLGLIPVAVHSMKGMFSSYKAINGASSSVFDALQASRSAVVALKNNLNATQQIQLSLQRSELSHAAPRNYEGTGASPKSDTSSGHLLQPSLLFLGTMVILSIAVIN